MAVQDEWSSAAIDASPAETGAPLILPSSMVVAAFDVASAAEYTRTLSNQTWQIVTVVHPVASALAVARGSGASVVFVTAGMQLSPTALEQAWWALDTHPEAAFVSFGDERGAHTPFLEAATSCVVMRASALTESATASDVRWPGLAPVFGALELGLRGHLVRERCVTRPAAAMAPDAPVSAAVAELRAKGLVDEVLGNTGALSVPPAEPLQHLDERPLPPNLAEPAIRGKGRRVLVLLQGFPMGGYAAFNADFLPRLVAGGHAVSVCTTEVWRSDWRLEAVRSVTHDVVHAPDVVPLTSMPRYVSYLIESRGIDVVFVSHSMAGYRMLPWLRRRHPQTAFVDYVHTDWFESQMYGSYASLGAAHAEWLDAQVASSQVLANELVSRGAKAELMHAVTINLDVADWDPSRHRGEAVRKALGCKGDQPLVLFAGRVSPEKRPLLAVECWKQLVAAGVNARFAVMGNGQQLGAMVQAVQDAGLKSRVEFLGELEGDMLRYVYSAADVYHAPSAIEGIARSLYEAMAMRCVPVVADVGGQRELVTAECGFLVPHGANEVARYVDALKVATGRPLRADMQNASRARIVAHFTSAQCVSGMERAFEAGIKRRLGNEGTVCESNAAAREIALAGLEVARRHFWRAQGR